MLELPVTILSFTQYQDKDTKALKIRIGYLINNKSYCQDTLKFRGYAELGVYLDDASIWDKCSVDLCGNPATFIFEEVPNPRNPLKKYNKLKEIKTKNDSIVIL